MASPPLRLDRIRVQTARMLEIYALLQKDLEKNKRLFLSVEDRQRLHQAILTIESNMRQLLARIVAYQEETSPGEAEAMELEEIVDAVLRWAQEKGE